VTIVPPAGRRANTIFGGAPYRGRLPEVKVDEVWTGQTNGVASHPPVVPSAVAH
jgi:hypothetical protein